MKLIADRKALVAGAISGYGTVGNDIVGKGLPFYDDSLPQREQDIDKAKSLLKAAGQEKLTVELSTSDIFPGLRRGGHAARRAGEGRGRDDQAQERARELVLQPVACSYLKMPFAETQWPINSLKFFYLQALASDAPYNETHWKNAGLERPALEGDRARPTRPKAQGYWNQVQKIQYDKGGYINWTNADWVDGLSKKVQGLKPSAARRARQLPLPGRMARRSGADVTTCSRHVAPSVREGSPVLRFIGRRSWGRSPAIFAASIVIFAGLPAPARQRRERRARPERRPGDRQGAEPAAAPRPARGAAVHGLARRLRARRSRQLRGRPRAGREDAPIWRLISNPVKNSAILALITALLMIPLSLGLGVLAAVYARRAGSTT